jgi:hypothetical protein
VRPEAYTAVVDADLRILLRQVADFGGRVEHFAMEDACDPCRALHRKVYTPNEAPPIPVSECETGPCRCDYLPV